MAFFAGNIIVGYLYHALQRGIGPVGRDLRIGYLVPSLDDTTGWGRWACEFLNHIVRRGIEPVLWAPRSAEKHLSSLSFKCRAHFVLPELFDYLQSRRGMVRFKKIFDFKGSVHTDTNIHLVHSLDAHPWGIYGYLLARTLGIPHVITTHGRYGYIAYNKLIDRIVYRHIIKLATKMITVSDAVRKEILKYFSSSIALQKIETILNAVDSEHSIGGRNYPLKAGPPVIVSVTRFIPVKDIETSLRAFNIVREKYPDSSFLIIGPGNGLNNSYYRMIKDLIDKEKIGGVKILGRIEKAKLEGLYMEADLLLHTPRTLPDDFEAYGLIIMEAGLFGLPVVATRSGGIPEVVVHGESGILVDERDYQKAAEAILKILEDRGMAKRLGEKGREIALSRNWGWYVDQQKKMYDEILSAK